MTVTDDRWTCSDCEITELLDGEDAEARATHRRAVQTGHAARHEAERGRAGPLTAALAEAAEVVAAFRVCLVVPPGDVDRMRAQMVRRSLPVEVFADAALGEGQGYVMTPRRGVRERPPSPGVDGTVDKPAS